MTVDFARLRQLAADVQEARDAAIAAEASDLNGPEWLAFFGALDLFTPDEVVRGTMGFQVAVLNERLRRVRVPGAVRSAVRTPNEADYEPEGAG